MPMTADELLRLPDDGFRHELVRGELITMPLHGAQHGMLACCISVLIYEHIQAERLGTGIAGGTGFQIAFNPDTVRAPDFAFICRERIQEVGISEGYWPGAPDLVVEVIENGDTYSDVEERTLEWLDAGSRMVLLVSPHSRSLTVWRSRRDGTMHWGSDLFRCGDILPGFTCPVAEIFDSGLR